MKITIKPRDVGQRLDKFLITQIENSQEKSLLQAFSRNQLQNKIKRGDITVNNNIVSPHYSLKNGDKVQVLTVKKILNQNILLGKITVVMPMPTIIAEEKDYLIINKPAGLIVHGGPGIEEETLVDWLIKKYPEIKKVGEDPSRPGIVHRLDKEASGLMVIAKNQNFFDHIKNQFIKRTVTKKYIALVYGKIAREIGEINFPITRSLKRGKMAALPLNKDKNISSQGKRAVTEYQVIKKYINFSLLKLQILTGRTHQIRVHLSAIDHPIVGDKLYGKSKTKLKNSRFDLNRVFLVACELGFTDSAEKKVFFRINLPEELTNFLKIIK